MAETLTLTSREKHLFIEAPKAGPILVDTGSPTSFGRTGQLSITLDGRKFDILANDGLLDEISREVGVETDILLGVDLLNQFQAVLFDVPRQEIAFAASGPAPKGQGISLEKVVHGIPVVSIGVNGTTLLAFLDTGAPISYLPQTTLAAAEFIEKSTDFYPGAGRFAVKVYRTTLTFGRKEFAVHAAPTECLPRAVASILTTNATHAILGNEVLENIKVSYLPGAEKLVLHA
ncbi:MAG: hypothetical protein ABFD92_03905 [Planctomycetaceae bacterium]|nr:retroviral-like aspartic protease family protein [Planctomycetaceae bacterium]